MNEEYENVPCVIGLCGRIGSGKTTVESFISYPVKYKQIEVSNRLKYIHKVIGGIISKEDLIDILNKHVEENLGSKLNTEGKYSVWTRDKSNFGKDMYNSFSFAEPLKIITSIIFDYDFNTLLALTEETRKKREKVKAKNGKTGRECLEYLGTDIFRKYVNKNIWADILVRRIEKYMSRGYSICVPDVRFKNEYQVLDNMGCTYMWVIYKNENELQLSENDTKEHKSRWSFLRFLDKDFIMVENSGSKDQLKQKAYDILNWKL